MKTIITAFACLVIVSIALGQNSATSGTASADPAANRVTAISEGTVTTYIPGKTITVKTDAPNPMSFAIVKSTVFTHKSGKKVKGATIAPGARVQVFYEGGEDNRHANRVVVQD